MKLILTFSYLLFSLLSLSECLAHHLTPCLTLRGNSRADTPKFGEPIQNQTIAVGREAVFNCVVDNLQTYKASAELYVRLSTDEVHLTLRTEIIS